MPKNPEKCKQDPFCQVYANHVLPTYCAYYDWQSEQDAKHIKITAANQRQAMDSIAKADDLLWEAERAALAQKGVAEDGQRQATVDDQKCQVNPEQKSITVTIEDQSQEMDCMAKTLCEENGDAAAVSFSVIDSTSDGQEWLDIGVSEAQLDSWALELEDYLRDTTAASSPAIDSTRDEQKWQSFLQTDEGLDSALQELMLSGSLSEAQLDSWALELEDYLSDTTAASSPAIDSTRDEQEWQSIIQTDEGLDSVLQDLLLWGSMSE
ncbi:hypothetical protein AB1Y20_008291 [Prymnesium parvum]|uniref:Uncharacterized protein n=1 Tax=Prymnesium parvum TaxID=97485 RepID=A0AB34IWF3_PRYPA